MNAGIYDLAHADYHADPCDQPTLSASIANVLLHSSPKHAWTQHPRLNPNYSREEEQKYDVGNVVHAILLQGADIVDVLDFPDWRTNAAKEARDLARSHGRVPLLTKQWGEVEAMVAAVRVQLAVSQAQPPLLTDGKPEQTLVWEEGGVLCRARLDWLRDDHAAIDDLKTTSRSASPEAWSRALFGTGCDVQAAFYLRGLKALTGVDAEWRWIVAETYEPYALSVVSLGPDVLELANRKVDHALTVWKRCLESGVWPAYPTRVAYASLPSWEESRWLERELIAEEMAA
jgi:hypothetical protein